MSEVVSYSDSVQRDLQRAITILKEGGCKSIFLFGSASTGNMHTRSDLDFAVHGCPPQNFFALLAHLLTDLEHPVDLVDLDLPSPFVEALLRSDKLVQLG